MSGYHFKNVVSHYLCLCINQSCKADSFVHLLESFRKFSRAIKVVSIWFSFTFTVKPYKHMVLWWREHISQSKFKDDIESLNTDDILSVNLKIEMENAMKLNFNLKSNTLILVNWNIENMYSSYEDDIFLTKIKVRSRKNLAIMRMPF